MTITQLPQRLEIAFWGTTIRLMRESPFVGFVMRTTYLVILKFRHTPVIARFLILASTGLLLGFILGCLIM